MEFRVLGPLDAVVDGASIALGTARQRALLGLLLVQAGKPSSYDRLADQLWAGDPPVTARHTLQGYAYRLRRALGSEAWRLATGSGGYRLKVSAGELDALRFEALAEDGRRALVRGDVRTAAGHLGAALALWRGPALADLAEIDAFGPERARLEALRVTAVEDRVDADLALGRHSAVVAELEALLAEQPFRERLWGQLMLALYRSRRPADALNAFHRARDAMREELGIEPSRWLCGLHEQILLQDVALDAPEPSPAPSHRTNLPAWRTTFVGRRREAAELAGLLHTRRLVCVTGPPGCGKTRLATEVAAQLVTEYPHGTCFVSLADIADTALVPSTVAAAVGVPDVSGRPHIDALLDHLRARRLLLVLDNFEHLTAAAGVIGQLLDGAHQLTVLVTSRGPLRISGEQELPLDPLPLPATDTADDLAGNDAVVMFVDRARAIDPGLVLDADSAAVAADIVTRLDGLPLAIELAAARLRLYPLAELARRLGPVVPLLTGGPVDHAARQRTLHAAISWSDELLRPAERALFRRLGVFRGGFTLDAAEEIASGPPVDDVPDSLSTLVEVSLVGRPNGPDGTRFPMLETIREYALDRLGEAGEPAGIQRRHARFFAQLAERAAAELTGANQLSWLVRLDAEHANVRAALDWCLDNGATELALDMSGNLWRFWQLRGHFAEGRQLLERALAAEDARDAPRAKAVLGLAGLCYWQFDLDSAERLYHQARKLGSELDDWRLELEGLLGLVFTLACHRGDLSAAAPLEREFQELVAEHGDPLSVGLGLATSQMMRLLTGDLEDSRTFGERCLAGTRELGERWYEAQILRTLALTSLLQQRYDQGEDELRECVQLAFDVGDLPGLAMDFDRLGQVAAVRGRAERACVLAGAAERLRETVGGGLTVEAFRWKTEPPREAARRHLSERDIETACARGRRMSRAEAVAYALAY